MIAASNELLNEVIKIIKNCEDYIEFEASSDYEREKIKYESYNEIRDLLKNYM